MRDFSAKQTARDEKDLNEALRLIKIHITSEMTEQNRDLHRAVQLIVTVARRHDLLEN